MPENITGIGQLKATLANFVSDSDALWVSDGDPKDRPIITRVAIIIYDYLHENDFKEYFLALVSHKRLELIYHIYSRLGRFLTKMVEAGDDFSTNDAIKNDDVGKIDNREYQKAVKAICYNIQDLKEHVDRGHKITCVTSLQPKDRPSKKRGSLLQKLMLLLRGQFLMLHLLLHYYCIRSYCCF